MDDWVCRKLVKKIMKVIYIDGVMIKNLSKEQTNRNSNVTFIYYNRILCCDRNVVICWGNNIIINTLVKENEKLQYRTGRQIRKHFRHTRKSTHHHGQKLRYESLVVSILVAIDDR